MLLCSFKNIVVYVTLSLCIYSAAFSAQKKSAVIAIQKTFSIKPVKTVITEQKTLYDDIASQLNVLQKFYTIKQDSNQKDNLTLIDLAAATQNFIDLTSNKDLLITQQFIDDLKKITTNITRYLSYVEAQSGLTKNSARQIVYGWLAAVASSTIATSTLALLPSHNRFKKILAITTVLLALYSAYKTKKAHTLYTAIPQDETLHKKTPEIIKTFKKFLNYTTTLTSKKPTLIGWVGPMTLADFEFRDGIKNELEVKKLIRDVKPKAATSLNDIKNRFENLPDFQLLIIP